MPTTSKEANSQHPNATGQKEKFLPDEMATELGNSIRAGELKSGDRLPSERELGEQFGVSRAVVREALSMLKSEELITVKRGIGAFVTERNQRNSFRMPSVDVEEIDALGLVMELLITIEVAATKLAAFRRTPEDLKRIRRSLIGMEYEIAHDRLGDVEDFAFHESIVAATHNPHFQALSAHLEQGARRVIQQTRKNTKKHHADLIEQVQQEHKAIYEAIAAGDGQAAAHAAETHLHNSAKRMNIYLLDA